MVPVAVASPSDAEVEGLVRVTVKVSVDSATLSSIRSMVIPADLESTGNVTVPGAAVKSEPAFAVPLLVV